MKLPHDPIEPQHATETPPHLCELRDSLLLLSCGQLQCSTTSKWMKMIWSIYAMEFYSAIKRSDIVTFSGK